jgi:hypothetical protein
LFPFYVFLQFFDIYIRETIFIKNSMHTNRFALMYKIRNIGANRIKRLHRIILLLPGFFFQTISVSGQNESRQSNILWIVCEDIYPFLSCYENTTVKTPNIDQLAKEGIRYTHVYTTAGVCAPSRSSIITGMYQRSIGTQHMRTLDGPAGAKIFTCTRLLSRYPKL